ncbi:MAG TPA: ABC transporter permease [bacterium]|nr:ABC transporter permease [bacterium]HQL61397.1 ABC transporter permease [bacterium]
MRRVPFRGRNPLQVVEKEVETLGVAAEEFFRNAGAMTALFFQAIAMAFSPPFRWRIIVEQMVRIGVESLPIALLTSAFTGAVFVMQTGVELAKWGAKVYSSGISAIGFARELGPVLTSVVLAGRVGAGITAEIGTMKVTEQIDALKTLATNPVSYLVTPRLIAAVLMLPAITVLAVFIGLTGGLVVGIFILNIPVTQYISTVFTWLEYPHYITGILKTVVFGAIIAVVGCHYGFEAGWGAEGVGEATTQSVVTSSILILIADFFLSAWILYFIP